MAEEQGLRSRSRKPRRKDGKVITPQNAQDVAKRREALKETLKLKLELEKKARHVVERLLEDSVAGDFLVDCARLITPGNYKDAVEERSIVKMCGYPVCSNKLCNVPKQQYKISTKTNKVYDITERKCFCSNFCYRASKYFEVQISKTPLWLRAEERPPDVKLLKEGESGSSGVEVKIADLPIREAEIENPAPEKTAPACDSCASGSDSEQDFVSSVVSGQHVETSRKKTEKNPADRRATERKRVTFLRPAEEGAREERQKVEIEHTPSSMLTQRSEQQAVEETSELLKRCTVGDGEPEALPSRERQSVEENYLSITQVGVSKRGAAGLQSLLEGLGLRTGAPNKGLCSVVKTRLLEALRNTLMEWRTAETLRFLYGTSYSLTPGSLRRKGEHDEEEDELDEDDLEDTVEELEMAKSSGKEQWTPSATVPDYRTLQKETELLTLRVREFYQGDCVLPEEVELGPETDAESVNAPYPVLPLVDSRAQHLIQKCIVVDKINRSLRDIVGQLRLTMNEISSDLNNLVRTFRFTNANIIHKSAEWTLIAVVLLFVLSEVSVLLRESLARPSSVTYISTLMKELDLKDEDLRDLVRIFRS